eukprot:TRINITY_DN25978_c0_g1_i1.p1 TRINITY_DN25978_c0_g1~~TRINITY_DN25978_c0_g1_i1.p1  ORF type:complete len:632 (-),score=114.00 TRINITY_DN25978_c0_g1_i1:63-1958(-)
MNDQHCDDGLGCWWGNGRECSFGGTSEGDAICNATESSGGGGCTGVSSRHHCCDSRLFGRRQGAVATKRGLVAIVASVVGTVAMALGTADAANETTPSSQQVAPSQPGRQTRAWWTRMAAALSAALNPSSDWVPSILTKVAEGMQAACLVGESHGSPFDRCKWQPQSPPRNICAPVLEIDDARVARARRRLGNLGGSESVATEASSPRLRERLVCDLYSKGTGQCSVNVDWNQWSLMHCGVYPVPAVSRAQGHHVQLFCPGEVPLAVVPVLKSGSTAVSLWLMRMEAVSIRKALWLFQQHWQNNGLVGLLMANQTWRSTEEIYRHYFMVQGDLDSSFLRFLILNDHMYAQASEHHKRKLVVKTVSKVVSDESGDISRYASSLSVPPHLCSTCCATGAGRLPLMFVRNPFSRLVSNWRVFVLVPTEITAQTPGNLTERQKALRRLRHFPRFVEHVSRIVSRHDLLAAIEAAAGRAGFTVKAPSVQDWPPGMPFSLGDLMHFVRVADLLASAPGDLTSRRGFLVHMERVDTDLKAAAFTLCKDWGHCLALPPMTRLNRKESWLGMKWGHASKASHRAAAARLGRRWPPRARRSAADAYAQDFSLLGYSANRPERRLPLRKSGGWLPGGGWWSL